MAHNNLVHSQGDNYFTRSENTCTIAKGQVIFHEGFSADNLMIIINGFVNLTRRAGDKTESLLDIRQNGDVIGVEAFSLTGKYLCTANAFTDCEILVVNRSFLSELRKSRNEEYLFFMQELLIKNIGVFHNRILLLKESSARTKIAYILLLFSDHLSNTQKEITLTREEMSALAEVSRETASRELSYFNKNKIIKLSGKKILIVKKEKLHALLSTLIEVRAIKSWNKEMESSFKMFKELQ
jgi:CRP-like cAMP-binding protein